MLIEELMGHRYEVNDTSHSIRHSCLKEAVEKGTLIPTDVCSAQDGGNKS